MWIATCTAMSSTLFLLGPGGRDDRLIREVKSIDVASLDTRLQSQPFSDWFRATVDSHADAIEWTVAACGLAKRATTSGICVRASAHRRHGDALIDTAVEIRVQEPSDVVDQPRVYETTVVLVTKKTPEFFHSKRLADLPDLLAKAASQVLEGRAQPR
jgi:hypothetical protein